jgi:putative endonuclease
LSLGVRGTVAIFLFWDIGTQKHAECAADHIRDLTAFISSSLAVMFPAVITRSIVRTLDWLALRVLPADERPEHLRTGARGEEDAYFGLRKMGYVMVARNYRTPRCRGEIDLIGWEGDVLCFIEVKTRTTREVKPAEAAVDRHKRREVAEVAREYLRHLPPTCQWRFDIVSVYYDASSPRPLIEIFQNASLAA